MEWIGVAVIAFLSLFVGLYFGEDSAIDRAKQTMFRLNAGRAEDRAAFLHTVSRELANLLVWKDPDRFLNLYRNLHAETSSYKSWKPEALQQKYNEISKKYPQYKDFDVIGVRTYVLYPDAKSMLSDTDLVQHYSDITRFVALLVTTDQHWNHMHPTSDEEFAHLEEYVLEIKDTKFRLRLQRAIQDFYVWKSGDPNRGQEFEYGVHSVRYVHHFAENRYGIHLKDLNEYGLYSYFVHDDGRIFHSYYRSDPSFEKEQILRVEWGTFEYFGGVKD